MNQSADENQCFFIENKEDYHHIVNVMRYKEGQNIIVTFSDENVFRCKIISINDQSIEIKLEEKQQINTELPQNITICSGLIKADKYEWMIQKATEMGDEHEMVPMDPYQVTGLVDFQYGVCE